MKNKKALKKLGAWKSFKEQMCIEGKSHKEFLKDEHEVWGAFDFKHSLKGAKYWLNIAVNVDSLQKISRIQDLMGT